MRTAEQLTECFDPLQKLRKMLAPRQTSLSYPVFLPITRKVPKFSDAKKLHCNLPKIEPKSPKLWVFCEKKMQME